MRWKFTLALAVLMLVLTCLWSSTASSHRGGLAVGPMPTTNGGLSCGRHNWGCATPQEKWLVRRAIYEVFGRGWEGRFAVCISYAESGHNPYAANFSDGHGGSYGAFQMNGSHRYWIDFSRIYDPKYNAKVARRLAHSGGWRNWTTYYKC